MSIQVRKIYNKGAPMHYIIAPIIKKGDYDPYHLPNVEIQATEIIEYEIFNQDTLF